MDVQEHLAAFDRWLTGRIEEAYAACKDLAFRDRLPAPGAGEEPWEYSLLEPGALAPHGEGWSVYRLQGVWPGFPQAERDRRAGPRRLGRSLWSRLTEILLHKDGSPR